MTPRNYPTPAAFRQALDQRLRASALSGADFGRKQQLVIFDRFLARITAALGAAVTLKGGLVLELRLQRARTTRDVDLRLHGVSDAVAKLQFAALTDLHDFMTFTLAPDVHHPLIQNEGLRYEGYRLRAECKIGDKRYGQPFGVDVAFDDPMISEPEVVAGNDVLAFVGVPPPMLRLYPIETHIAEKLHAYTLVRARPNSRVKDLPDIALLASTRPLAAEQLHAALIQTFSYRKTHDLPRALPPPPETWHTAYANMALDDQLRWSTLTAVTAAARAFLDPILNHSAVTCWTPQAWQWT